MNDLTLSLPDGDTRAKAQRVTSVLVRFWIEPRELAGALPALRTYVRDLQSGEEAYLADLEALVRHLTAMLRRRHAESAKAPPTETVVWAADTIAPPVADTVEPKDASRRGVAGGNGGPRGTPSGRPGKPR